MATASLIKLDAHQHPQYYVPGIDKQSSELASELLNVNHRQHHVFFNNDGFHNHIAHHLLTVWALKADAAEIRKHYENNKSYQRRSVPVERRDVSAMSDPERFKTFLGHERYYHDFVEFFQEEIDRSTWQNVLLNYVFARDARSDDMLVRLFAGFLHPIIHLGFGVEFEQPAIIAEGLAQAAVHDTWMGQLLLPAEKRSDGRADSASIVQLLDEMQADDALRQAPRYSDGNKLRDGVIGRAGEAMIDYAARVSTKADDLDRVTAEMVNASVWYTGGAQRAGKQIKFDFFYIHCVNCSIFFSAFLKQHWIKSEDKVRLLEWKIRNDIAMYASRGMPPIHMDLVRNYKPRQPSGWDEIIARVCRFEDDGHASKLVRALAHGQNICKPYEDREEFRVKHDDWLQLGHMAVDSVESGGPHWVRSAGFDEAWEGVGDSHSD